MATLQVAVAHLEMIHQAIDAVDSKAMFYVGLNFVGLGIFVGALGPLGWSVWAAVAPGALTLIVASLGGWTLLPRDVSQFPAPDVMAAFEGEGYSNDQLAWTYIGSYRRSRQAGRSNQHAEGASDLCDVWRDLPAHRCGVRFRDGVRVLAALFDHTGWWAWGAGRSALNGGFRLFSHVPLLFDSN